MNASADSWMQLVLVQWPLALAPTLFTWLLPVLLGYARGPMAQIGVAYSVFSTLLLSLQFVSPLAAVTFSRLQPALLGVFAVYAVAGLAICAVGVHDRRRTAAWATLGVLSFIGAAMTDTLARSGIVADATSLPWGLAGAGLFAGLGLTRRSAVASIHRDLIAPTDLTPHNRTRRSRSIPRKLVREGQLHWLPIYPIVMLSDLAREGMLHSGSYRFADHIYRLEPSGRGPLGCWIDRRFLELPASRAFQLRYKHAQAAVRSALESFAGTEGELRVLAVPCGLPRDVTELATTLRRESPALLARVDYTGMDIDPEVLRLADEFTRDCGVPRRRFVRGNALERTAYPACGFHAVVSTGLGEFLETFELEQFYRNVHAVLRPGGTFYTSATALDRKRSVPARL
jgi:hypothetical protein